MDWVWTWSGKCFGYISNGNLRTYSGVHVGNVVNDEIFGRDGHYLGEIKNGNRLITCNGKMNRRGPAFTPYARNAAYVKYADYAGYAMYAGYSDFPPPESF